MKLSDKLKRIRKMRKMTQLKLAEISGVSNSMICDIEKGRITSPSIDVIRKLSDALMVSPIYFINENAASPFDIEQVYETMPSEMKELILKEEFMPYLIMSEKAYKEKIPPHVIEKIIQSIKDVIKNPSV